MLQSDGQKQQTKDDCHGYLNTLFMFFHPDVEPDARPGAPNTSVMTATAKLCGITGEVADSRRENRLYPYTSRMNATTASIEPYRVGSAMMSMATVTARITTSSWPSVTSTP
jgi:hypothetical protein